MTAQQEAEIERWIEATGRQYPEQVTYTQDEAVFWQRKAERYASEREDARTVARELHWSLGRTDWEATKEDFAEAHPWLQNDL